ncbi:hypothetical protein Acor_34850 [Acrocarpospora corrugata]|uniref:OmpR/PhoB-type domain-containing protein n=1 Tax=Acrocarpospora corrugata TaxID=35763 RepID=A0A5M3W2Q4_9ACTN|nr:hypothetical protein Acor_34850 [Acrocarpospora corrugata]
MCVLWVGWDCGCDWSAGSPYRDGLQLPATKIGSLKARTLLALLAVRRGRLVSVDRIIEVVWDGEAPRQAAENVATLVSRLRSRLGAEVISGARSSGYRLGDAVRVDLHDAAGCVGDAEAYLSSGQLASAVAAAVHALALLDGAVALDSAWAQPAHALHAQLLRQARHARAEAALRVGDAATAAATAEAAVRTDPLDEAAYRSLMVAYHLLRQPARALTAYQRLRATLASELGALPSSRTRDLHNAISRDSS